MVFNNMIVEVTVSRRSFVSGLSRAKVSNCDQLSIVLCEVEGYYDSGLNLIRLTV